MAQRRTFFQDQFPTPASPMTPKGGSQSVYGDPNEQQGHIESPDTFRRRTTPITGTIPQQHSTLQELLAMLNDGGQ